MFILSHSCCLLLVKLNLIAATMMKGSTGTSITLKAMNMALLQIEDQETKAAREDPASAIEMMVGTEGRGMMTETRINR